MVTETKQCICCRQTLRGRSDKKFCSDYCRNTHHNQLNSNGNNYMRNINHCLRRNRRILLECFQSAKPMFKIPVQQLAGKGFLFNYHTHEQCNRKGSKTFFCYELGYRLLDKDQVLIVKDTHY